MNKRKMALIVILLLIGISGFSLFSRNFSSPTIHTQKEQVDQGYHMRINNLQESVSVGVPVTVKFDILDPKGETVKDFEIAHEKSMHLIVVRDDLQDFQHVHPDLNDATSVFSILLTFPNEGKYRLFADYVPYGEAADAHAGRISYQDIQVGKSVAQREDIVIDTNKEKIVRGYEIEYKLPEVRVGEEAKLVLRVTKNGVPITTMEPYLGAQAHGILLKKDTLELVHLHAMGGSITHMMDGKMMTMETGEAKGPEITFAHTFASAGVYKLFTQFQHEGSVITAEYVIDVK